MATKGTLRFCTQKQWPSLLSVLAKEYRLYGPQDSGDPARLGPVEPGAVSLGPARMVDPLKALLFQVREDLGGYFGEEPPREADARAVVGAVGCDLASLAVMDYVFLEGDIADPQYRQRRDRTFVLSQDCTAPREACFCVGVGGAPYPAGGFDVNASPVDGGVVLEAGTERGEGVLEAADLPEATPEQVAARDRQRAEVTERVRQQAEAFGLTAEAGRLQECVRQGVENPVWQREAEKCVECGACNFICPTCHCFLLTDLEDAGGFRRFKNWDACQYEAFARVAGGANPRPRRWERLRNRFDKKFDFFVTHLDQPACTGCGRCVEACPGQIDLREILKELVNA